MVLCRVPLCGSFPLPALPPIKQLSDTSWVSYSSTQFLLPGDSTDLTGPTRLVPAPPRAQFTCVPNLGCSLYFRPAGYRSEAPTCPSLGLINLLQQLAELREALELLDDQFIMKYTTQKQPRLKRCLGKGMRKGCRAPMITEQATLPKSTRVQYPKSAPNPILWGFYGDCYIGMNDQIIGYWWLIQINSSPSAVPKGQRLGLNILTLITNHWSFVMLMR